MSITNAEGGTDERVPVDEMYADQYQRAEDMAYRRVTGAPPGGVLVDTSEESLAQSARGGAKLPKRANALALSENLKEPSIRQAVNSALSTVTGGVLSLDAIDEHLRAQAMGETSPLVQKLKSSEAFKLLDPGGNVMEQLTRETAKREGWPQEVTDRVAPTVGLLAGLLAPTSLGTRAKLPTEILMNSMFSNPVTHAANVTANALTSAWSIPERFLSATASAGEWAVTLGAQPRTVFFGEPAAMTFGMLMSTVDAIRAAGTALRTGKSVGPSLVEELTPQVKALADETVMGHGMQFWSAVWRSPTRGLAAEDAFFKTINRQAEIYAQAYREAAATGDLSLSNLRQLIENPDPIVKLRADQFAIAHTFQRELNELGPVFGRVGAIGQDISELSIGVVPVGKLVAPVIRTPTNLAHFATERTPILGQLSQTWRNDFMAGGALRAQALGKMGGGATLAATVAMFAGSGLITGGGPIDLGQRRNLTELTGWQPYSIRVGDTYYAYDRLAPLGAMLGILADYAEIRGELPEWKATEIGQAIWLAASRNLTSKTFLEGASDLFNATSGDGDALARLGKSVLRTTTPGVMRAAKKITDPVARETEPGADPEEGQWAEVRGIINAYRAQTPGYSKDLPPRRNLWGDPILLPSGWGPDWASPVFTSVAKRDPAGDEIVRLEKKRLLSIGRAPRTIFGRDPEDLKLGEQPSPFDTGIELTDLEYDQFVRLAGNELKIDGLGLHDKLNEVITKDKDYAAASDALKAVVLTRMVTKYRTAARAQLLTDNEGLLETYRSRLETKANALGAGASAPAAHDMSMMPPEQREARPPAGFQIRVGK